MSIFGVGGSQFQKPINPEPAKTGSSYPTDPETLKKIDDIMREISGLSDELRELNNQATQIFERLKQIAGTPDTKEYRDLSEKVNYITDQTDAIQITLSQKMNELAKLYTQ